MRTMMRISVILVLCLFATPGRAQPPAPPMRFAGVTQETGFGGASLTFAMHTEAPFVFFDNTKAGNARFTGITVELIERLSTELDFQYTLTIDESQPEAVEGALSAIGMEAPPGFVPTADIAAGVVHITNERITDMHFSQAFFDTGFVVTVPRPKSAINLWAFLTPFSVDLWVCVIVEMIIVALLFFLMEAPALTIQEGGDSDLVDGLGSSLVDSLYWSVSALTCTLDKAPRTWSGKLVMLAHGWFYLIIIASYTANLASDLTSTGLAPSITGWNDVTAQGKKLKLSAPKGLAHEAFLGFETKHHGFQFDVDYYDTWEQAMDAARLGTNGAAATFHDYAITQYYLADTLQKRPTSDERCGLLMVGSTFAPVGYGFAFPLDSSAFIAFSQAIVKLKEEGEIAKLVDKYGVGPKAEAAIANLCPLSTSSELFFKDFHGLCIMAGVICAVAVLVWGASKAACDQNKPDSGDGAAGGGSAAPAGGKGGFEEAVQAGVLAAMGDASNSSSPAVQAYRASVENGIRTGLLRLGGAAPLNGYPGVVYDVGAAPVDPGQAWLVHSEATPMSSMPPSYPQPGYVVPGYGGAYGYGEG